MAIIQNTHFHILRDSLEAGSICEIEYQYDLVCEASEVESGVQFDSRVHVCTTGLVKDHKLGQPSYDPFQFTPDVIKTHVKRKFIVPCEILNEAIGEDEIFLEFAVHASNGSRMSAHTNIIRDHF